MLTRKSSKFELWQKAKLILFITKYKPIETFEPNYGNSDSLKRIRRHWGRAQASTTLFFPTLFSLFFCMHSLYNLDIDPNTPIR